MKYGKAFSIVVLATILTIGFEFEARSNSDSIDARANATIPLIYTQGSRADASQDAVNRLLAKARRERQVDLIVGLDLTMRPVGDLSDAERISQSQRLLTMQDTVFGRAVEHVPGAQITRFKYIPYFAISAAPDQIERLFNDPLVVTIQVQRTFKSLLSNTTRLIGASSVWQDLGIKGKNQVIAVLDTGFDTAHPMLAGKVIEEACFSTKSLVRWATLCPNGKSEQIGPSASSYSRCADKLSVNECAHGTLVSSIAAGQRWATDNGPVLQGVAPEAKLILVTVFRRDRLCDPACVTALEQDIILGLEYVYDLANKYHSESENGTLVSINLSFGSGRHNFGCFGAYQPIISALRALRIVTVAAAGNEESNEYIDTPACLPEVVAVASSTNPKDWTAEKITDGKDSSDLNQLVAVVAPASPIRVAWPEGERNKLANGGTSSATPHVAGAIALMREAKPNATVDEIVRALVCTGTMLSRGGWEKPRINVAAAVQALVDGFGENFSKTIEFVSQTDADGWDTYMGFDWSVVVNNRGTYRLKPTIPHGQIVHNYTSYTEHLWGCAHKDEITIRIRTKTYYKHQVIFIGKTRAEGAKFGYGLLLVADPSFFGYVLGQGIFHDHGMGWNHICNNDSFSAFKPTEFNVHKLTRVGTMLRYDINGELVCSGQSTYVNFGLLGFLNSLSAYGSEPDQVDVDYVKIVAGTPTQAELTEFASPTQRDNRWHPLRHLKERAVSATFGSSTSGGTGMILAGPP